MRARVDPHQHQRVGAGRRRAVGVAVVGADHERDRRPRSPRAGSDRSGSRLAGSPSAASSGASSRRRTCRSRRRRPRSRRAGCVPVVQSATRTQRRRRLAGLARRRAARRKRSSWAGWPGRPASASPVTRRGWRSLGCHGLVKTRGPQRQARVSIDRGFDLARRSPYPDPALRERPRKPDQDAPVGGERGDLDVLVGPVVAGAGGAELDAGDAALQEQHGVGGAVAADPERLARRGARARRGAAASRGRCAGSAGRRAPGRAGSRRRRACAPGASPRPDPGWAGGGCRRPCGTGRGRR